MDELGLRLVVTGHETATLNDNIYVRFVTRVLWNILNLTHYIHSFYNLAKYNMFTIQVRSFSARDEKLTTVGVWASVGHRQQTALGVFQLEIFVIKLVSPD
jgi:hypothetical protein